MWISNMVSQFNWVKLTSLTRSTADVSSGMHMALGSVVSQPTTTESKPVALRQPGRFQTALYNALFDKLIYTRPLARCCMLAAGHARRAALLLRQCNHRHWCRTAVHLLRCRELSVREHDKAASAGSSWAHKAKLEHARRRGSNH